MQLVEARRGAQQRAEIDARLVADVSMVHLRCSDAVVQWCSGAAVQRCCSAAVLQCCSCGSRERGEGAGRTQTSPNLEATAGRASNPITCETQGQGCGVRAGTRGKMRVRARAEVRGGEAKEEGEGAPALSSRRRPTAALPARRARSLPRR